MRTPRESGSAQRQKSRSFLSNGGETLTVMDAAGTLVDSGSFTSAVTGTDGVSANRSPDATRSGAFVLHTTLFSTRNSSPGTRADGTDF